jgi:hypothetical protein
MAKTSTRARALRASLAVTLGGAIAAVGCGTSQSDDESVVDGGASDTSPTDTDSSDTGTDASSDAQGDAAMDVAPDAPPLDVGPSCADEPDDVCPDGCTVDDDYDCCVASDPDWCTYDPEWGCGCAVEGPFAPPTGRD